MIVVKKKMKKSLLIIILSAVLAVLIAGAVVANAVMAKRGADETANNQNTVNENLPTANPAYGEYSINNQPYVFKPVEQKQIEYIQIRSEGKDKDGEHYYYEYSFLKPDESEMLGDSFVLSYVDEYGNTRNYFPDILIYDSETDYSSLYAVSPEGNYNIPKLFWLCSGIGNIRFSERIELSSDSAESEKALKSYGLSGEDYPLVIRFNYEESEGVNKDVVLQVGSILPTGSGYYFRVGAISEDGTRIDYRPFVYTTLSVSSLSYAFLEVADFINPILVAEGLPSDNAFEPYLTTDFKQWKNKVYMHDEDKGISYVITGDAHRVILKTTKTYSSDGGLEKVTEIEELNLKSISDSINFKSLINSIVGKSTGKYTSPIAVTGIASGEIIDLTDEENDNYIYHIERVDAIMTDAEDKISGTVAEGDKIRITYTLTKNGEKVLDGAGAAKKLLGAIDLSSALIPADVKEALVGKTVGADIAVDFAVDYNDGNTVKKDFKILIDEIIDIRSVSDYTKQHEKVQVGSMVSLRVYDVVDGVKGSEPRTLVIEIEEEMSGSAANIKAAVMGASKTKKFNKTVDAYVVNLASVSDFVIYEVNEILGMTTREQIVSFKYTQDSERDIYEGNSIYMNTMDNDIQRLYALEPNSCEGVVSMLGGLLENANHSEGLVGLRTVDVVITPEKMIKYGLYANTIYFELPRNILPVSESSKDYTYLSTLGFTLYVSDENPVTKTRYIASDMYDIIAEIGGDGFVFLDETFLSFYAKRNLVLTAIENIHKFDIEFFLDEMHGKFTNELTEHNLFSYNGKTYGSKAAIIKEFGEEAIEKTSIIPMIRIHTGYTAWDGCPDCQHAVTELQRQLQATGKDKLALDVLYGGKATPGGEDLLGTDGFKEFIGTLFWTIYQDELTDEDKLQVTADNLLMRFKVDLGPEYIYTYKYVYEFYRVDDRRVAVKLYKQNPDGDIVKDKNGNEIITTDFYISTFAFKKLVSKYYELMNAQAVDKESAFTDYIFWE